MSDIYQTYLPYDKNFHKQFESLKKRLQKANEGNKLPTYRIVYLCLEAYRNMTPQHIDPVLSKYDLAKPDQNQVKILKNKDLPITINLPMGASDLVSHITQRQLVEFSRKYTRRSIVLASIILAFNMTTDQAKIIIQAYTKEPI